MISRRSCSYRFKKHTLPSNRQSTYSSIASLRAPVFHHIRILMSTVLPQVKSNRVERIRSDHSRAWRLVRPQLKRCPWTITSWTPMTAKCDHSQALTCWLRCSKLSTWPATRTSMWRTTITSTCYPPIETTGRQASLRRTALTGVTGSRSTATRHQEAAGHRAPETTHTVFLRKKSEESWISHSWCRPRWRTSWVSRTEAIFAKWLINACPQCRTTRPRWRSHSVAARASSNRTTSRIRSITKDSLKSCGKARARRDRSPAPSKNPIYTLQNQSKTPMRQRWGR